MSDYQNYIPKLFTATTFFNDTLLPQGWKDYITDTPNISNEYANILVGTLPD